MESGSPPLCGFIDKKRTTAGLGRNEPCLYSVEGYDQSSIDSLRGHACSLYGYHQLGYCGEKLSAPFALSMVPKLPEYIWLPVSLTTG